MTQTAQFGKEKQGLHLVGVQGGKELTEMGTLSSTYTEAKVEQEEDVECHVNLQREVFVEVLTGLDGTVRQRQKQKMLMSKGRYWQWSVKTQGHFFEIKMFHEK